MTADRATPGPLVLGLVAGVGFVAIAAGAAILLSLRGSPPVAAREERAPDPPAVVAPVLLESAPKSRVKREELPPEPTRPEPPRVGQLKPEPVPVESRYRVGATVEQEVVFTRKSVFVTQGVEVSQAAEYAVTSEMVVDSLRPDGGCVVTQTIRSTKLGRCDPAMQKDLKTALEKTLGTKFAITLAPDGTVAEFRGPKDAVNVQAPNDIAKASYRVWSLLDSDAWKDLAGVTFLHSPSHPGPEWESPITHDWGPLGTWAGKTTFKRNGQQIGQDRVDFAHALTHKPPESAAPGDLPFKVVRMEFRPPAATGSVLFDATKGRVTRAEESFTVRGRLVVSALGTEVTVDVEERQDFQVAVREPGERSLKGAKKK
jgi:hypothetical protein